MIYDEIVANKRNSYFLILLFLSFLVFLGYLIGWFYGNTYLGLIIAMIFSIAYVLISYYTADKMILQISSAKEVRKEDYPHLVNSVEGLALASGIYKPKIYVIEDSAINAFATGRDPKHASITVTTGAVERLNRTELEGVVGHEMSHIKNYDIRFMMLTVILVGIILLLTDFFLRSMWFGNRNDRRGNLIILVIALVFSILAPIVVRLIQLAVSRQREYLADADGALLTRYPKGLADALKKIRDDKEPLVEAANRATAYLYIENPMRNFKKRARTLFSTHPDINDRIRRLEKM